MSESQNKTTYKKDDELIGVLTAISVVSKHLASKIIQQSRTEKAEKGAQN